MGRKALDCELIFEALKNLAGIGVELRAPINHLQQELRWSSPTINKYLRRLHDAGVVSFVYGSYKSIVAVKLLMDKLPEKLCEPMVADPTESKPEATPPEPTVVSADQDEPKAPEALKAEPKLEPQAESRKSIAVFVDYENAVRRAQEAGFHISFTRLLEEMRVRGNVVFAEVFIPPHVGRQEVEVRKLWDAGWVVIYCPLRHKDKDAVDEKLSLRARDIVRETNVSGIVIVSEDVDFMPLMSYAKNHGKSVERFLPSEHQELAGCEHPRELFQRPEIRCWQSAVDIALGQSSAGTPDEQGRADFIRAIVKTMHGVERQRSHRELDFNGLIDLIWRLIKSEWNRYGYSIGMAREAISTLVERKVVVRCHTTGLNYYVLTSDKALLDAILALPAHC